jgi:hypothetical protein
MRTESYALHYAVNSAHLRKSRITSQKDREDGEQMKKVLSLLVTVALGTICGLLLYLYFLLGQHQAGGLYDPEAFIE